MGKEALLPVVSVVIPVYNCERYLADAIDSVAAQNMPLELIVVDDCSTDKTEKVFEQCQKKYADRPIGFVFLKNEENKGVAYSRNRGIVSASCEYVALLDGDDIWRSDKLKKQLPLMHSGAVLSCTGREFIDENGQPVGLPVPVKESISYNDLLLSNSINCSSVIAKTSVAREFPMMHDECHEDYLTWLKVVEKYGEAKAVNEPLLLYRRHSGSKTSGKLNSAVMHYNTLRLAGVSAPKAVLYFFTYAVSGVIKHFIYGGS